MTASLRAAIAFTAALLLVCGSADAKVGWVEQATASTYQTEHFRVLYQSGDTRPAYAKAVGDYVEAARNIIFGDLGYQEPSWLEGTKLDIYVTDIPFNDRMGFKPFGVAYQNLRILDNLVGTRVLSNPWIEIDLEKFIWKYAPTAAKKEYVLKALVVHEFFHVVQYGYDVKERSWLKESTATWVEDKVFDPPQDLWESTGWVERFPGWENYRGDISVLSSHGANEYAASIFFQYLSERRPGSISIVRRIWEEAAKQRGHNTYSAIATALGDGYPWGPNMRARFGEFAVATLIQSPSLNSTYSFRKLEDMKEAYLDGKHPPIGDDEVLMQGIALQSLDADRIRTKTLSLKPFQVGYFEIEPPESAIHSVKDLKEDANVGTLIILARGKSHRNWDLRLVEVPRRETRSDPVEKWTVRRLPRMDSPDRWVRIEVENFPRKQVFLVAVNTEAVERDEEIGPGKTLAPLSSDEFEIAAVILTPPVVTSFSVDVEEGGRNSNVWRAVWKVVREPASRPGTWRTRTILTEGLKYEPGDPKRVRFRLQTSRPVLRDSTLTVGGQAISLRPGNAARIYVGRDFGETYSTDFVAEELITVFYDAIERLEAGEKVIEMEISMNGYDSWKGWFDENVSTAPILAIRDDGRLFVERWEGERTGPGGQDKLSGRKLPIHQLKPSSYLAKLEAFQNGSLIYQAEWRPDASREGARQLDVEVSTAYDPEVEMAVFLEFSEPVSDVRVRLASAGNASHPEGYIASIPPTNPPGHLDFYVDIPPSQEVMDILKEDAQLGFYIDAKVVDGARIDGDPRTAAWYDWDDDRWYALEEGGSYRGHTDAGGTDDWHKLNAAGQSIVLLLDASGSMEEFGRMPEAKKGIAQAIANLKATDEAALIVFYDCGDIRIVVPFTQDAEEIVEAVQGVEPSGNTPLGDAINFSNAYLQRAARFQKRKLLTFSDGGTTCGASAATAIAELGPEEPEAEPEEPEEETPSEIRWTVYRVGTRDRPSMPDYWVEDIEYRESDFEDDAKDRARLTVRRYPVSYMSSRGRTVWSINWSRPRGRDQLTAAGREVPELRARAEAQREGAMEKSRVRDAMQRLIGPGAVALRRER